MSVAVLPMWYWYHQVTPYKKFPVLGNANFAKATKLPWHYGHKNTYHDQVGIVCCLRKVSPIFVVWLKCQLLRLLYDDQLLLGRRRVSFQKNKKNFDKLSVGQNHFNTKGSRTHKLVPAQKKFLFGEF